jgi:hypothetical protein
MSDPFRDETSETAEEQIRPIIEDLLKDGPPLDRQVWLREIMRRTRGQTNPAVARRMIDDLAKRLGEQDT